jgi:hypothetical protein
MSNIVNELRFVEMILKEKNNVYDILMKGDEVQVKNDKKVFTIVPIEKNGLKTYDIIENGKRVKKGLMFSKDDLYNWTSSLKMVENNKKVKITNLRIVEKRNPDEESHWIKSKDIEKIEVGQEYISNKKYSLNDENKEGGNYSWYTINKNKDGTYDIKKYVLKPGDKMEKMVKKWDKQKELPEEVQKIRFEIKLTRNWIKNKMKEIRPNYQFRESDKSN